MYRCSFIIFWTLLNLCVCNELLNHDGVLISNIGDVRTAKAAWTVIVTLDQPPRLDLAAWATNMKSTIDTNVDRCSLSMRQLWESRIASLTRDADIPFVLMKQRDPSTRVKRGLLDFVGEISKMAFGTATVADVREVAEAVAATRASQRILSHNQETLVSVLNQTRRFVQENRENQQIIVEDMHRLHNLSVYNLNTINNMSKILTAVQFQVWMHNVIDYMEQAVHHYTSQLQLFHLQRSQLHRGWLTMDIASPDIIKDILVNMANMGQKPLPLSWYYRYTMVEPLELEDSFLTFAFKLYGVTTDPYVAYQFNYLPVMFGEKHTRTVTGRRNLAVNSVTLASFEPKNCIGANPIVCLPDIVETKKSCEYGLLMNNLQLNCTVAVSSVENSDDVILRPFHNKSLVVVAPVKPLSATMRCPGATPRNILINCPQIITVKSDCSFDTPSWRVVGIEESHAEIHLVQPSMVELPRLNISWPVKLPAEAERLLDIQYSAEIPVARLTLERDPQPVQIHTHPGLWTGVVLLVLVIVSVLCVVKHRTALFAKASAWARADPSKENQANDTGCVDPGPNHAMIYPTLQEQV